MTLGRNVEEALDTVHAGRFAMYYNCGNMEEVANKLLNREAYDEFLLRYFDYNAYARDLEIEGDYVKVGNDCI